MILHTCHSHIPNYSDIFSKHLCFIGFTTDWFHTITSAYGNELQSHVFVLNSIHIEFISIS